LFRAIGDVIGTEGRGKHNNLTGATNPYHGRNRGLTFWAPNINIFRDPRWGRGQETPGEDPTLNGEYATEFVTGMQSDQSSGFLKASAALKHFAGYSVETGRSDFAAIVTAQDMEDTYLPAFEAGVVKGNASGIMCSYNAETYGEGVFGPGPAAQHGAIPSCANKGIMNDLARGKWGFEGYITSDCGAVAGVKGAHHYTNSTNDTVTAVLAAGLDSDCGDTILGNVTILGLLQDHATRTLVDTALRRLFTVQFRLGFGDPDSTVPWAQYSESVVNTPANQQLAKEAADQSLVLLKNNGPTKLPWVASTVKTVAVIGRNAQATGTMQGSYHGTAPFLISPFKGISKYAKAKVLDGTDISAAVALVGDDRVGAVVLVVGLTQQDEAEGHDRLSLLLPGNQSSLIKAVAAAAGAATPNPKPVVVVVMSGGPVDMSDANTNDNVGGVMWCGYPGQAGGDAIADALFGATNAFGKLSMTWYPAAFADQVAIQDMGMRPNKTTGNPGRTYRFYTGTPVFKFGAGLSYTKFATTLEVPATASLAVVAAEASGKLLRAESSVVAAVTASVQNTGQQRGDEVVLLFARSPNAGKNGTPLQELIAFERVTLEIGERVTLDFHIHSHQLTSTDINGDRVPLKGTWEVWAGIENEEQATAVLLV
jgi:beta-glucosidase-like glycosyl hydrolase